MHQNIFVQSEKFQSIVVVYIIFPARGQVEGSMVFFLKIHRGCKGYKTFRRSFLRE